MTKKARQQLMQEHAANQYEQIGRFVVHFEHVCFCLRFGITFVFIDQGLRNQSLSRILIDNRFMTAGPLIEAHDAIMTEIGFRDDPVQKEVLDQVSKEFHALIEERNKVVHGLWMIGWGRADDPDISKIAGHIGRPSKREGMRYQELPKSAEEIAQLVERAQKLGDLVMHIHMFLTTRSTGEGSVKLEDGLTKVEGVWTSERVQRAGPL